jgi:hypothetical protein
MWAELGSDELLSSTFTQVGMLLEEMKRLGTT